MTQEQQQNQKFFKAGDIIMKQDDDGKCAYIIESGCVEIIIETLEGDQEVGTRGPGAMIGEMAIVDNKPRTATVKALEDCKLLEISKDNFAQRMNNADPVIKLAMQVILIRYRDLLSRAQVIDDVTSEEDAEALEMSFAEGSSAAETIKIANDFEHALEEGQISLHYQPIINLKDDKIAGFEALMRWEHPERGFISPGVFIPVLEESGLIVKASQWALKESMAALKRIEARAGFKNELFMSVNFSSHDFSQDGFVDSLYEAISKSDMHPSQLHVEITERLLMGQPEQAKETLDMVHSAGIHISIDDFGTGYSSLSYLHSFPIDTMKIDRSFIMQIEKDPGAKELVRSIIDLGQNLNMSLIAEGIETDGENEILKEMGCDMAQGYLYCKPMPEKDATEFANTTH